MPSYDSATYNRKGIASWLKKAFLILFLCILTTDFAQGEQDPGASPSAGTEEHAAVVPVATLPPEVQAPPLLPTNVPNAGSAMQEKDLLFSFQDADIKTVVEMMARMSGLIAIIGEDVKGKLSVTSGKRLTLTEAYRVFNAVLDVRGFTIIKTDTFLKVMPKRDALQKPIDIYFGIDIEQVPEEDRVITQIIPISNTKASTVLDNVRQLISPTGNIFVNQDTNALVVTDSAMNIRRLLKLIAFLDIQHSNAKRDATTVYAVRYMKAKDLADALGKVFTAKAGETAEIRITPVETVNSLVVTADIDVQPAIQKTIAELDIRKRQVLIEAKIVEVTLTKGLDFGLNLVEYLFQTGDGLKNTLKVGTGDIAGSYVNYTVFKAGRLNASLQMLAKDDRVNILSAPRILTSDNQKARILVGQEQPILKSTTVLEGNKTVSDYVYKDVGIELEVTPRITIDRDIALDLQQKVTSILSEVEFPGGVKAPLVGKREANTSVVVQDGQTLVIGGLMKNDLRDERQKVPILGDIPVIGWLFSRIRKVNERTELLVFITPTVIMTSAEGAEMAAREEERTGKEFKELNNKMRRNEPAASLMETKE